MSAKTQIVVLHMKEVIYTCVFAGLSILLIFLFLYMFLPDKNKTDNTESATYTAGIYTSSILFNNHSIDVQVVVDANRISSISLVSLDESVTTMYPLVEPALEELARQIVKKQSTEDISYSASNQYTSLMLLDAINSALAKASTTENAID